MNGYQNLNGTLYFSASIPTTGREPWKLVPGQQPVMLGDLIAGPADSNPAAYAMVNNTVYFTATHATMGTELWRVVADGPGGTNFQTFDLNPNGDGNPFRLIVVGDRLYFQADDGTTGNELWEISPLINVPSQVADINPGAGDGLGFPTVVNDNGTLFFAADNGTKGVELWKSGPVPNHNTSMVEDIAAGMAGSNPNNLVVTNWAVNHVPIAAADTYTTRRDQILSIAAPGPLLNDSDPDGDTLTVIAVNGNPGNVGTPIILPSGARLTLNANGLFTYTPPSGFMGQDSFGYTISDGYGGTATSIITINIMP